MNVKLNEYYSLRRHFHLITGNADLLDVDGTHLNNMYPSQGATDTELQHNLLTWTHLQLIQTFWHLLSDFQ